MLDRLKRWARRFGFRAGVLYLFLQIMPFPLDFAARFYGSFWESCVAWTGRSVLGRTEPLVMTTTGSGDTRFFWVRAGCMMATALVAGLVWSLFDQARKLDPKIATGVRVCVRYGLAMALLVYGVDKVFEPTQFSAPTIERMLQPLGEMLPQGLLWTFMGFSKPYQLVTGWGEIIAGLLLLFHRTTPLGALLGAGILLNVVILNLCYDVPVKLYSMHLLLFCVVLLAPDFSRFANVLILNRPTAPAQLALLWPRRTLILGAVALKVIVLGLMGYSLVEICVRKSNMRPSSAAAPLAGFYEVVGFVRNGVEIPPSFAERARWRWVYIDPAEFVGVKTMSDDRRYYHYRVDAKNRGVALGPYSDKEPKELPFRFAYEEPEKGALILRGRMEEEDLAVKLKLRKREDFLLNRRGFRWVSERPHIR